MELICKNLIEPISFLGRGRLFLFINGESQVKGFQSQIKLLESQLNPLHSQLKLHQAQLNQITPAFNAFFYAETQNKSD